MGGESGERLLERCDGSGQFGFLPSHILLVKLGSNFAEFGLDDGDGVLVQEPFVLEEGRRTKNHNSNFGCDVRLGWGGQHFLLLFFESVIFCYF